MAANLKPFQQPSATAAATAATATTATASGHHNSDTHRKNWWTPLFGWSPEPDYIATATTDRTNNTTLTARSDSDHRRSVRSRKSPVNFTDEKARKLRMLTVETESFHDAMYHSAIASRFASDFSDRSDL